MTKAANALNWCVGEMERRYKLMSALGVRNLSGFNSKINDAQKAGEHILPIRSTLTGRNRHSAPSP
jgi:S-DNA-T family DNA segregation ATPase FtsK/SpoIIIE